MISVPPIPEHFLRISDLDADSLAEVIDGEQSVVWQQAENRLPAEEALVLVLVARRWDARALVTTA